MRGAMKRIVVLISGRGSNLQALLSAPLGGRIERVISNNPSAKGLDVAREHGIDCEVVNHRQFPDRASFDTVLADRIDVVKPDLIVLAGFMRILTKPFVDRFSGRIINIHPSLLPAFPGTDTHQRALQEGVMLHGCSVHFVTAQLDHGPIIIQAAVAVQVGDDAAQLAARVLQQEHRILPQAIRWFLDDRLVLAGNRVKVQDAIASSSALIAPELSP
jgi:phosphoribosylglycinamide formyltransferase-1